MGADDRQLGEVGGHVVEENRSREAELDPATTPDTRAEAGRARVEQRRHAELDRCRVQVVEAPVVRGEALTARVQLEAAQAELGDGPAQLGDRRPSLPGVDRGEPGEHVGVALDTRGDEVVGQRRQAHRRLRVPREQDGEHVVGAELVGHLVDGAQRHLGAEVTLGRLAERAERRHHPLRRRQVHVQVDRAHAPSVAVGPDAVRARPVATVAGLGKRVGTERHELRRREQVVDRARVGGGVEIVHAHAALVAEPAVLLEPGRAGHGVRRYAGPA